MTQALQPIPKRTFEKDQVSSVGLGLMGLSSFYGTIDSDEERFKLLDAAYEAGCTFWDTADVYGDSEDLLGKWFKRTGKRSEIFLSSKCGVTLGRAAEESRGPDGSPEYIKAACAKSLERLGVDQIDLFYLHRMDANVPIEKSMEALAELVKEGKIRYIGLSECSARSLIRASKIHKVSAVQYEFSPFTLDITYSHINALNTARELGVKVVAYAPVGRGLLTGRFTSPDDFEDDDFRKYVPKFSKENFPKILHMTDELKKIGDKHNATAGQVSIAWVLAQGQDIIPIPGTKRVKYMLENTGSANIKLSEEEIIAITKLAHDSDIATVERYPHSSMDGLFADTPEL